MTPASIRDGFAHLRTDQEMRPLADAAESRAEADWLVGINGTRAMTAFNSKSGGFHKTTVGRVQTPTLAVVVDREKKIKAFVSRDYWEVIATFDAVAGQYTGRWFDEKFSKDKKDNDDQLKSERIWEQDKAESIRGKCLGKPGIVTEESKPSTQLSPLLYDLTTLQREANSRFGFSAKSTLGLAQALYEKHKVLTYPRTDSRALPEDYLGTVKDTLETLKNVGGYSPFADKILAQGWVVPNKRIFNNARVSDHFAIIPTTQAPNGLSEAEQKLYDMVAKRFLAVFYPAAEFLETTRITRVEGEPFKTAGKVLLKPGWLEVYGREAQGEDAAARLVPVQPNESVNTSAIEVKQSQTKPPPRYTEATLLSAMEGAGKLVEDDELRAAMAEKGLGTPATRAAIIEGLIAEEYMHRQGKELVPTAKAFNLMVLLEGLGVQELTKPELTGDWEFKLRQVHRKQLPRQEFMDEIRGLTERIVGKAKSYEHDTIPGDFGRLNTPCPKCGGEMHETYKKFQCQKEGCDFAMWKLIAGRQLEPAEVEELVTKKQVGPLQGFRSRLGKPFAAILKLSPEFKVEFDFGNGHGSGEGTAAAEVDFTGKEPVGQCPKCGARVFENGMSYVCEKAVGSTRTCAFRAGKVILQQPIERVQMTKLLETRKTDLLVKFISRKGRPFKAFLVLDKEGDVRFEFEKREAKLRPERKPKEPQPKIDFTGQEPLGKGPRCGGRVFESDSKYLCEKSQAETGACKFSSGKTILTQPVSREQMTKLLATGRTDLLKEFVSKRGNKFSAWLVLDEDGKVSFEFPPRESEAAPAKEASTKSQKAA
jgi:DNA topoisomerase-3